MDIGQPPLASQSWFCYHGLNMNLTQEERIARHKSFLQANWEIISAFSWGNYLEKGRGAVLVPEEDFVYQPIPVLKGLRFHYLPMEERGHPDFKGFISDKELGWLEAYDADERVILIIIREDGSGVSSYLIGGRSRPSEAWAGKKAELN